MARITKPPEVRRLEILEIAENLFKQNGYDNTSVDAIIKQVGVAKGTFYYYFKSKTQILEAIVDHTLGEIEAQAQQLADESSLDALTKMGMLLSGGQMGGDDAGGVAAHLHLPANQQLHLLTNIQIVKRLSPILAKIVEQGIKEKVFATELPLETVQFLFTGAQFLLDGGLFDFGPDEMSRRRSAMQKIVEKSLGAALGSFDFMKGN